MGRDGLCLANPPVNTNMSCFQIPRACDESVGDCVQRVSIELNDLEALLWAQIVIRDLTTCQG